MRLADADVLAVEEGAMIPPLEVRLDLRPGDRVGLYEEVRHPSMGSGYSPIEAIVLGCPEPGWFIGETEDGREVTFHAGNVADVCHASPAMGGLFDWVKKLAPPGPGEMIQRPMPPPSPLLPAPAGPERKGLIAQLKSLFVPPTVSPEGGSPPKSIFDVFRKPEVPAGLPAERPSGTIAPRTERPSVISVFAPQEKTVIPVVEQVTAPAVYLAPGEKTVIPFVEAITAPAVVLPKSAELEPFAVREQKQKELWSRVISEVAPEGAPIEKVVEIFTPEEVQPEAEVIPPNIPARLHRTIKVLPLPRRRELLPSVEEIARGFATTYQPIDELWEVFRRARQSSEWQQNIEKYGTAKEEFETLGTCGGQPHLLAELSTFFHLPWEELRNRAVIEEQGDQERWVNTDRIWMDIITPLTQRITQAFDLLKPPDLPGQVVLEPAEPHGPHEEPCVMTFAYVEGEPTEEPEKPRYVGPSTEIPEEEEEEEGQETEAAEEFTSESLEEAQIRLEKEMVFFLQEREKLNPKDKDYRAKLAYLEREMESRRNLMKEIVQAISALEEEEEAKRTPAKKKNKPSKRGKKKGK